jgi:hypothetical protein
MTKKSKRIAALGAVVAAVVVFLVMDDIYGLTGGFGRVVDGLIARNVEARGGAEKWRAVDSLRLSGQMDLGQGMHVPYTVEQKRPGSMCIEFEFDNEMATQCVSGGSGWKLLPFMGRPYPETMTDAELAEMADAADIDGLLFDAARRGSKVRLVGKEMVDGRETHKLEIVLPRGARRWIYLDAETALEVKLETIRTRNGREQRIETLYSDWRETDGLLIPRRQESRAEGGPESHWLTVESVTVNPQIADYRFANPALVNNQGDGNGSNPS